jgi:hypothetical protein
LLSFRPQCFEWTEALKESRWRRSLITETGPGLRPGHPVAGLAMTASVLVAQASVGVSAAAANGTEPVIATRTRGS